MTRIPDPRKKPWLTVAELAEITGEGEKAIRSALKSGHIPVLPVGRYQRIPTAALLTRLGITAEENETDPDEPSALVRHLRSVPPGGANGVA